VDLIDRLPQVRFRRQLSVVVVLVALLTLAAPVPIGAKPKTGPLGNFKNIVVIYEENHSFDNLYGLWGDVNGQHVVGLDDADAAHTTQIDWTGAPYDCLLQTDISLQTSVQTYPVMSATNVKPAGAVGAQTESCTQDLSLENGTAVHISSAFENEPYEIDDYIPASAETCPDLDHLFSYTFGILDGYGLPGGCTRDLVHRFYQEQYQINSGNMNRYITGSDSAAMSMGYYDTTQLPIYEYLHSNGAPKYVIADHFFQAAFGGSYLNHQYLIAAAAPAFPGGVHSVLDSRGYPTNVPLYANAPSPAKVNGTVTQECGKSWTVAGLACGDYSVNTVLPYYQPTGSFAAKIPVIDNTSTDMTIGDLLTDHNVSWAYYGGGWDNAAGNTSGRGWTNGPGPTCGDPDSAPASADGTGVPATGGYPYCPNKSYQQHHYPFAYYSRYIPGAPDRSHLQDEEDFFWAAANGQLPSVSFVKPVGIENEHPGYTNETDGSDHLVDLIQAVMDGPQAGNTLIVVTYDEFGGEWDHVPPPSNSNNVAAHDEFGPGTRIPALILGRSLTKSGVDHTYYDTLSIMRTIEAQWNLGDLGHRDADVNDLGPAVSTGMRR
jgi:phospholipase C